jgi:hypothetical protein
MAFQQFCSLGEDVGCIIEILEKYPDQKMDLMNIQISEKARALHIAEDV